MKHAMRPPAIWRLAVCSFALTCVAVRAAHAVNIAIDYTYDGSIAGGSDFFGAGNPQGAVGGAQARASIEAAADYFSLIVNDSLVSIETPPTITDAYYGTTATFEWSLDFTSPGSGMSVALDNETIAADQFRVYVGGRSLADGALAEGGPGGVQRSITVEPEGGFFLQETADEVTAARDEFFDAVDNRGNPGDFGNWGGSITFDDDSTMWNFAHTQMPESGEIDFFSVAIHEIAHTLGFGGSDEWLSLVDDENRFTGAAVQAVSGDPAPLDDDGAHWAAGVNTTIYGTSVAQPSVLDRIFSAGDRQLFGTIDAAALTDLGWDVAPPDFLDADFNFDALVNSLDLTIWENAFGDTSAGDANGDAFSDGADFLLIQRQYGQNPSLAGGISPVPEPTAAVLACLAAMLAARISTAP